MISEFLKKVLPEGLIVIAKPASKGFAQVVCKTTDEAVAQALKFDAAGKDCYFGLGSLRAPFLMESRKNKTTGEMEDVKVIRVGANIAQMKCLFLDLDVEAGNENKYETQVGAVTAVRAFCRAENFPAPMLVNSGGGVHAYWPFDKAIEADQWRIIAQMFKGALAAYGLKADPTRTADASSVLRVVGTHNYKGGMKRPVELIRDAGPYPRKDILIAVTALAAKYGIKPVVPSATPSAPASVLGANTVKEYPPSDIDKIIEHCAQMADMVVTGGATEPIWYAGLQVARHTTDPKYAAILISQAYVGFDINEMNLKLDQLAAKDIGPTSCAQFCMTNAAKCEGCMHRGKITSPIQLGEEILRHMPAPSIGAGSGIVVGDVVNGVVTTIEDAEQPRVPYPYKRDGTGRITLEDKNTSGVTDAVVVHEHSLYPAKRTHSERHDAESTLWRINQPITGWKEFTLEQSILSKPDALHGALLAKGLYVTPGRTKLMVSFMIAYIKQLQQEVATEQLFSRLGWREDYTKFVLGGVTYCRDGVDIPHQMSAELKAEIPGLRDAGTLEGWKEAIQFYNAPSHEAARFMLYCGFGCPLLHMTGHKGVIVNASGVPGAGKTTSILAANSIFGHPVDLLINGTESGSTVNALYSKLAAYKNIPFGMDEITLLDPKVFGKFCLTVNQGTGKLINTRAGTLSANIPNWATMVLSSANTDVYLTLSQSRGDAAAEAMRVLQIPFDTHSTYTKNEADKFIRDLKAHHGVAAPVFLRYVAQHYEAVQKRVVATVALVDAQANISSGERFWSGCIASAFAGALAARSLGLLDGFPIEEDFNWIVKQISTSRSSLVEHIASPDEVISEFLEARVGETLVVSQTLVANIAPRIDQAPRGALCIRHEVDAQRVYVMKSEFKRYCQETGANYGATQKDLEARGILLDRNKQVVLGKGTDFGKGQVRCWELDLTKLGG